MSPCINCNCLNCPAPLVEIQDDLGNMEFLDHGFWVDQRCTENEPPRVSRRPNFLREKKKKKYLLT